MQVPPTAIVISLVSLAFSFSTTFVAYWRTHVQDIQAARQELRKLLERLISIPRESLEANKKYAGDRGTLFGFDQLFNQENTLLSRQAAEIARGLPAKLVSATEYLAIAVALQRAYNLRASMEFLELAVKHATDFNDKIAAIRTMAALDYTVGNPEAGRAKFQEARDIFKDYALYDPYTQATTHILTELQWANSEGGINQMALAWQHIENAQKVADELPYSPGAEGWKAQVAQARMLFSHGGPAQTPPGVPVPFSGQTPT